MSYSRPRTALLVDEAAEAADLSGRGLTDMTSLQNCSQLSVLMLYNNTHLTSCEGLQHCSRLWSVDLQGCALSTAAPLVQLGALAELQLGGNRLSLDAALQLRGMAIGRLGLQANPLLPDDVRTVLLAPDAPSVDHSRLLRSFLIDELPGVIALDDSFVTSIERRHCHVFFESSASGRAMRALLLPGPADHARHAITVATLRGAHSPIHRRAQRARERPAHRTHIHSSPHSYPPPCGPPHSYAPPCSTHSLCGACAD
jgi:hypothetical protein